MHKELILAKKLLIAAQDGEWENIHDTLQQVKESYQHDELEKLAKELSFQGNLQTGNTLGHYAAISNKVKILQLLYDIGVSLRSSNFSNRSPLEEARHFKSLIDVETESPGKSINFILNNVYSPVEQLFYGPDDFDSMVTVFTKHLDAVNDVLHCYNKMTWACLCAEEARLDELRWLYAHGANFHAVDEWGNGLLHLLPVPQIVDDDYLSEVSVLSTNSFNNDNGTDYINKSEIKSTLCKDSDKLCTNEDRELPPLNSTYYNLLERLDTFLDCSKEEQKCFQTLIYLLSLNIYDLNKKNNFGATPAHVFAEKSNNNPLFVWKILQLLCHCKADLDQCDDDGANVAMVLASNSGDGQWLSWCLTPLENNGGGCNPNKSDLRGKKVEDYIVTANIEIFDSELDIEEEFLDDSDTICESFD